MTKTTRSTRKTVPSPKTTTPPAPTPTFIRLGRHMKDAYEGGTLVALSYKPGDTFLGAFGEADRLGFNEPITRSLFLTGYLQHLPNPVIMNDYGAITKIGRVREPGE